MAVTQNIPNTLLSGTQTFTFNNTTQQWANATITIDRTVASGLNSLTSADTLQIVFQYSPDGGTTWNGIGGSTLQGGTITVKGVTLATDTLSVGQGQPFPSGTGFRVTTTASSSVRIAGTVVYS